MIPTPSAIALIIQERIAQLPFRPYTLTGLLPKVDEFQTEVKWDANVGGATVNGRATVTNPTVQNTDQVVGASLPIGNYLIDHTFSILGTQLTQMGNLPPQAAPRALRSLFVAHVDTAFSVIYPRLNFLLWNGLGAANTTDLQVYGLASVIAAGSYANINPATYPLWEPLIVNNAGVDRPLSEQLFSEVMVAAEESGRFFDTIITTPKIAELYKTLYDVAASPNPIGAATPGLADLGYTGMALNGIPIRKDKDCPEGTFWFINSGESALHTFAQGQYGIADPSTEGYEMSVVADSQKTEGINFLVAQLPRTNPQALSYNISVMPQMKYHNRRQLAVITDIAEDLDQITFSKPESVLKTSAPA